MLGIFKLIRRTLEGSILAVLLIGVIAYFGVSETINVLIKAQSVSSLLFLLVIAIVLADIIAKLIGILNTTFPDLLPKLENDDLKRASIIKRISPGQTIALLSGAYSARVLLFVVIFALLGTSYSAAPKEAQELLFGDFNAIDATETFLREGIVGSLGYFLFFLGPDNLKSITNIFVTERLSPLTLDGDIFLAGIRLYGFAFVLAALRTLVTPITYLRARLRAKKLP